MKKRKSPLSLHCSTTTRTCYKNIVWSKAGTSLPTRLTGVLVASEVRWGYIGKHELVYWVFIISTACFIIRLGLGYFDDFSVNFDMWWRHQATILCLTYWCSLSLIYRLDYTHYTGLHKNNTIYSNSSETSDKRRAPHINLNLK